MAGNTTAYSYNALNDRLLSVTSSGGTVFYAYDTDGTLKTITTAGGTVYGFNYDQFGRTTSIKLGTRTLSSTAYKNNTSSLVSSLTYGNGSVKSYVYDDEDRVKEKYVDSELLASYNYDKRGNITKYTDAAQGISWSYEYDLLGRATRSDASDGRYIGYKYDSFNRIYSTKEGIAGTILRTVYEYDDQCNYSQKTGLFNGITLNGTRRISYTYDKLNRLSAKKLGTASPFVTRYTYLAGTGNNTTTLVKTVKNGSDTLEYSYDEIGNITSIKKNGAVIESYTYDGLNQLKTVTRGSDVYDYTYDNGGNILSVKKNGESIKTYTYGNTEWKDLLTGFNGDSITYDAIGNPLAYRDGYSFTWQNGRQLATATNGTNSYSYTYNADGYRTSKTVNGVTTDYYWLGSKLQAQKTGSEYIIFLYDENGSVYGFLVKNGSSEAYYYYIFNVQGDVIGIINSNGTQVVSYEYSAWGEILSVTGTAASTIGQKNPLRYRGYYYDTETGFYYVSSRYYDPEVGRWINSDSQLNQDSVLGYNQFTYCGNNPINTIDETGNCWHRLWIFGDCDACAKKKSTKVDVITSAAPCLSVGIQLSKGWRVRIDDGNTNTKTKTHIHLENKGQRYAQNIDGSPHDGSTGSPPNSTKKEIKKKLGWDWDKKEKSWKNTQNFRFIHSCSPESRANGECNCSQSYFGFVPNVLPFGEGGSFPVPAPSPFFGGNPIPVY